MKFKYFTACVAVAFGVGGIASSSYAGSITQPGETAGIDMGTALPQGVYFVNTGSYGGDRGIDQTKADLYVNIPVAVWSTPWKVLGGRVEAYAGAPEVALGVRGANYVTAGYNPVAFVGVSWDLGHGWDVSNFVGGYVPVDNVLNQDFWTFNERFAVTYHGFKGWTLTAHNILGITGNNQNGNLIEGAGKVSPDYDNLDMTAMASAGKFSYGAVSFFSTDISGTSVPMYQKQSQLALGALAGYNFGGATGQVYVTRDVYTNNYFNMNGSKAYESRLWLRLIVPLWHP